MKDTAKEYRRALAQLDKVIITRLTTGKAAVRKTPQRPVMGVIRRVIGFFDVRRWWR